MKGLNGKCNTIKLSKKRKLIYNFMNLIVFGSILFLILFTNNIVEASREQIKIRNETIENTWRNQLRISLQDLKEQFILDMQSKILDPFDQSSVEKWSEIRLAGRKISGPHGAIFLIEFPREEIVWSSKKIPTPSEIESLRETSDTDEETLLFDFIFKEMKKSYSTTSNSRLHWILDEKKEFIEWVILPTDRSGFLNEPKTIDGQPNPNYKVFILGYAIDAKELFKPYLYLDKMSETSISRLTFINYFVTVGGIVFVFWFFYLESRKDE